nr:MAG TPA: hypothetical protein [Caudoviricetes sp.]
MLQSSYFGHLCDNLHTPSDSCSCICSYFLEYCYSLPSTPFAICNP